MKTVFIRDLGVAKELSPEWVDAFEEFMPRWLERFIPFHQEAREKGVELFEAIGVICHTPEAVHYEKDGIGYLLHHTCGFGDILALDGDYKDNEEIAWRDCFRHMFPEVDKDDFKRVKDFGYYNSYMSRVSNIKPPYDIVAKRADAYLKNLTGDSECGLSLGSRSFLYFTERAKSHIIYRHYLD